MRINHSTKALALGAVAFVLFWAFPSTNAQEHPPTASTGEVRNKDVAPDGGQQKDTAAGEQCKSYGAPAVMRVPGNDFGEDWLRKHRQDHHHG